MPSGKTQTSTTTNTPWSKAQPFLEDYMKQADSLLDSGKGYNAPGFSTTVPFSADTNQALAGIKSQALSGNPLGIASQNTALGILDGSQGPNTEGDYRGLLARSGNDAFQGEVNRQATRLGDDINAAMSGLGRYGSGFHADTLANEIGDFRSKAMADNWNQNIANERGILGDITGLQQQGITNKFGALSAVPGVYEQMFAPYNKLGQVGSAQDDLATRQMQEQIDKFNAQDMAGWNRLGAANAFAGGYGGLGGSQVTSAQQPNNWLGGALGGAMAGSQIMPGIGTLLGGGLGLLSGFL